MLGYNHPDPRLRETSESTLIRSISRFHDPNHFTPLLIYERGSL